MSAELKIPEPPRPEMARPRMRTAMLGATPQSREPTSKVKIANIATCLAGKMEIHCANARLNDRSVRLWEMTVRGAQMSHPEQTKDGNAHRNPLAIQLIWVKEWN